MLDILKAGEEVFTRSAPPVPVSMLTAGIKTMNPGMYGDERHQLATRLQQEQARDLDALHEVAEMCAHAMPLDCPDLVIDFILRALDASVERSPENSPSLSIDSGEAVLSRRKTIALSKVA